MIRPLRKRHRLIWMALLVIISILFIKSYKSPVNYPQKSGSYTVQPSDFVESVTAGNDYYDAAVGTLSSGGKVLQLYLKVPFRSPAPGVYVAPENNDNNDNIAGYRFLGRLNEVGRYEFKLDLPWDNYQLMVYDPIKKTRLETFKFQ